MDPEIAVDQDIDAAPLNIDPPAGLERDDAPERALPDPEAAAGEHAHAAGAACPGSCILQHSCTIVLIDDCSACGS